VEKVVARVEASQGSLERVAKVVAGVAAGPQSLSVASTVLRLPPGFKLSVLMPVYNEYTTLPAILERVLAVDLPKEVIIVDVGSTDGAREHLITQVDGFYPNVRVVFHEANHGKGAAIRTAIPLATGTVCVIQDSDLEYNPDEYPRLLQPILDGRADAVYGSRFLAEGPLRLHFSWQSAANRILTTMSNLATNLKMTDMETGYKVVRTELLQSLKLVSDGFEIEPELTAKLARVRARICEVPVSYSGRGYAEGKKIHWRDGVRALWSILRHRVDA
jgi:glycosyltransferase involved in cell wall biosynthesis